MTAVMVQKLVRMSRNKREEPHKSGSPKEALRFDQPTHTCTRLPQRNARRALVLLLQRADGDDVGPQVGIHAAFMREALY